MYNALMVHLRTSPTLPWSWYSTCTVPRTLNFCASLWKAVVAIWFLSISRAQYLCRRTIPPSERWPSLPLTFTSAFFHTFFFIKAGPFALSAKRVHYLERLCVLWEFPQFENFFPLSLHDLFPSFNGTFFLNHTGFHLKNDWWCHMIER